MEDTKQESTDLEGLDVETLVGRFGPMPAERVVAVLEQVCDSLAEAHDTTLPRTSVTVMIVLLNVDWMWAMPAAIFFLTFFLPVLALAVAIKLS